MKVEKSRELKVLDWIVKNTSLKFPWSQSRVSKLRKVVIYNRDYKAKLKAEKDILTLFYNGLKYECITFNHNAYLELRYDAYMERFIIALEKRNKDHHDKEFPKLKYEGITIKKGKRQDKIFRYKTTWGFVEKITGKIMKAASYNAPEPKRYERGNIFNDDPLEGSTVYGPRYRF